MKKRGFNFWLWFWMICVAWYIAAKWFHVDFDALTGVNSVWLALPALGLGYMFLRRSAATVSLMGLTVCVYRLLTANGLYEGNGWILTGALAVIFICGLIVWIIHFLKRLLSSTFDTLTAEPCWRSVLGSRSYAFGIDEPFSSGQLTAVLGTLELDLSRAQIQKGAVMSCSTLLGRVRVILPDGTSVKVYPVHLLGSTRKPRGRASGGGSVSVKSTAVLGRVVIR